LHPEQFHTGLNLIKYEDNKNRSIILAKKKIPELKVEHGESAPLHFLSMLEYKRENYLCIIDNMTPNEIGAYVLDYAEQEDIPVVEFLSIVTRWFYGNSDLHSLSVEIGKQGLTTKLAPIYRSFDTTYVSRIVGNSFRYDLMSKSRVRRRRVIPVPEGVVIKLKRQSTE
jgi:hypothetical protein